MNRICFAFFYILLFSSSFYAQDQTSLKQNTPDQETKTQIKQEPDFIEEWNKNGNTNTANQIPSSSSNIGSLISILLLFILGLWLFLVFLRKKISMQNQSDLNLFPILGHMKISPAMTLSLIEIEDKIYVLGYSSQHITTICIIDNPDTILKLKTLKRPHQKSFLKTVLELITPPTSIKSPHPENIRQKTQDFLNQQLEKIKRLKP